MLENVLLRSWDTFIDRNKLIASVLQNVRDCKLKKSQTTSKIKSITKLKMSRFELNKKGILIWMEFSLPYPNSMLAVGTCEMLFSHDGEQISQTKIIGDILYN